MKIIRLANTDHEAVRADVKNLIPLWNERRQTWRLHPDMELVEKYENEDGELVNEEHEHISGYRIDIIPISDRVVEEAEYDEEGNLIKEAKYAGELRIDIVCPEDYPVTEFNTKVTPTNPDHKIL